MENENLRKKVGDCENETEINSGPVFYAGFRVEAGRLDSAGSLSTLR